MLMALLVICRNVTVVLTMIMPPMTGVNTGELKRLWVPSIRVNTAQRLQKMTRGRYNWVKVRVRLNLWVEHLSAVHNRMTYGVVRMVVTASVSATSAMMCSRWPVKLRLLLLLPPTRWISRGTNIVPSVFLVIRTQTTPGSEPFRSHALVRALKLTVVISVTLCTRLAVCEATALVVTRVSECSILVRLSASTGAWFV